MNKIYKREIYLKKIRGFYDDPEMIKVITGIRRCGKSTLLEMISNELKENGVKEDNIIFIKLDKKPYKSIKTPEQLEELLDSKIKDEEFKYIFIDEVQNVKNFEPVLESFRLEGKYSMFITGSNSYLLSGELVTKLTGRKIEIEMLPLNFYEFIEMKKELGREVSSIYEEFESYIKVGGFPGTFNYDSYDEQIVYVRNVLEDIFEKDIKKNEKIKNKQMLDNILKYITNNFGSEISINSIVKYYQGMNVSIDYRTVERYINILINAKVLYPCENFDIKSKCVLEGEKKYYLADLSIYYALNVDNRINYGPVLENILHNYLISKDYYLSVGKIGNIEVDFIARKGIDNYYYIQVSKSISEEAAMNREYRPFYEIRDMYPRYLFLLDIIVNENVEGIRNVNIAKFIANNEELQ